MEISVDESIYEEHDDNDHDPVIVALPEPRSKAAKSDEDNINNEVDYQEKVEETASLLDQTQMTTRSKSRSDNNSGTDVEPETEYVPIKEVLRSNRGKDSAWRSRYDDEYQNNTLLTNEVHEVQSPRDFGKSTEDEDYASKFVFTQMSMKKGIQEFGDDATKSIITEFTSFDEKEVFYPRYPSQLIREDKIKSLKLLRHLMKR